MIVLSDLLGKLICKLTERVLDNDFKSSLTIKVILQATR